MIVWVYCVKTLTKVVALAMQMLDRKPSEEPVLTVEEQPIEYDAYHLFNRIQLNNKGVTQPIGVCVTFFLLLL